MTIYLVFECTPDGCRSFVQAHASKRIAEQTTRDMGKDALPGVSYVLAEAELLP